MVGAAVRPLTRPMSVFPGRETIQNPGGALCRGAVLIHEGLSDADGACSVLLRPFPTVSLRACLELRLRPSQDVSSRVKSPMWEGGCLHQVTGWCGGSNTRPLFSITRQLRRALFTGQEIPVGPTESAADTPSQLTPPHAQSCPP